VRLIYLTFNSAYLLTYQAEQISQRQLAARYRVALSFIVKLLKQWGETKDLAPKPYRGGQKLKLSPAHIIILGELVQQKNDATQKELSEQLALITGIKVSSSTISRTLTRLNLTVKKNF
jgi:transposase